MDQPKKIKPRLKGILERVKVYSLIEKHGVLNCHQICRLLNGRGKDEYPFCYFTFKEKPKGSKGLACRNIETCKYNIGMVLYIAKSTPRVKSIKLRHWDSGGIGTDIFRFFFIRFKALEPLLKELPKVGAMNNERRRKAIKPRAR